MKKVARLKLIMSYGNSQIKVEMFKADENFIVRTKRYFLAVPYSKRVQFFETFDEAEDRFAELKNEIKLMSLMK